MAAPRIIAKATAVTWPATFWNAIRARPDGPAAIMSRLPRVASPASVPDSAMTDHRPKIATSVSPIRHERKPPRVSTLIGSPSSPRSASGSAVSPEMNCRRSSMVENSGAAPYGAPVPNMNAPATRPTTSAARRLSRTVLPYTECRPMSLDQGQSLGQRSVRIGASALTSAGSRPGRTVPGRRPRGWVRD